MASSSERTLPNILITGTPGTGKTTHALQLLEALQNQDPAAKWEHINVSEFVKERGCHTGWNEEWESYDVDEDKLLDELELIQGEGGKIIDWHSCDCLPERWIDLVIVLSCDHTVLWNRLEKRGYPLHKIQENNDAEIMQVIAEEARDSFAKEIVVELSSESAAEMDENIERIVAWVKAWRADHSTA